MEVVSPPSHSTLGNQRFSRGRDATPGHTWPHLAAPGYSACDGPTRRRLHPRLVGRAASQASPDTPWTGTSVFGETPVCLCATFKFEKCRSTGPLSRLTFSSQETEDKGRKSSTPGTGSWRLCQGSPTSPAPRLGHDGGSFLCPSYETLLAFLWSQRWTEGGRLSGLPQQPTARDTKHPQKN